MRRLLEGGMYRRAVFISKSVKLCSKDVRYDLSSMQ